MPIKNIFKSYRANLDENVELTNNIEVMRALETLRLEDVASTRKSYVNEKHVEEFLALVKKCDLKIERSSSYKKNTFKSEIPVSDVIYNVMTKFVRKISPSRRTLSSSQEYHFHHYSHA